MKSLLGILLTGAVSMCAQQPAGNPLPEPAVISKRLNASYYRTDGLASIDCDVAVDWKGLLDKLGQQASEDRMKPLNAMGIRVHAVRGMPPEITLSWPQGYPQNKDALEGSMKQTLGGFFQFYWSLLSGPLMDPNEQFGVERLSEGGLKLLVEQQGTKVTIKVDQDFTPTYMEVETPAMKLAMDLRFTASPNPKPGDLRRLAEFDVSQTIGTNTMNVNATFDYQRAGDFNFPQHMAFEVGSTIAMPMEFKNCSAVAAKP